MKYLWAIFLAILGGVTIAAGIVWPDERDEEKK